MNDELKSVITCDLDGKIETFSEGAQDIKETYILVVITKPTCLIA